MNKNELIKVENKKEKNVIKNIFKNKKKVVIISVIVLIIVLLSCGGYYYLNNIDNDNNNEFEGNTSIGIDTLIGDTNQEVVNAKDAGRDLQKEAIELNKRYSNVIGWLRVPGTSIDKAVFQSGDNTRYLRSDRDNTYTQWGEFFLDYRCDTKKINEDNTHYIIYGHNTNKDDNFTPLLNYKNKDFLEKHKTIEFSTLEGNYKWEIFSVFVTDINYFYIDTNFADANEFMQFIYELEEKSMHETGTTILGDETILTLSTCDYSRADGRFVICAKLIEE